MGDKELKDFGIDQKTLDKSGDIFPPFDLSGLEDGAKIFIKFVSQKPKVVEHKDIYARDEDGKKIPDAKKNTGVLEIFVEKVARPQDDGSFLDVDYNETFSLWLSSKSLSIGIAKISQEHNYNLEGVKAKIHKGKAQYKDFGENTCYSVSEVKEND